MSSRRAPPGRQLGVGRIRVDAGRAIAKLREYRLADPTAWILEAIRGVVASGATRIALDGDADEVWLRWDGPTWPAAGLPSLLDELVSPEPARDAYHRRLLAAAINSALGLDPAPAWVDVIAVGDGAASRVRFTPDTVTAGDDGMAALDELTAESVPVPDGVGASGGMVHLRRRAGLSTFARFVRRDDPPELVLARVACNDIAVAMTLAGRPIGRDVPGPDLLRVPLGEGLEGFVALVDPAAPRPPDRGVVYDIGELGVRVVREIWLPPSIVVSTLEHAPPPPLRVLIDGDRMPTNASRSQVRGDAHPIAAGRHQGERRLGELVAQLAAALGDPPAAGAPVDPRRERLRAAALALVASGAAGVDWDRRARGLSGPLAAVAALPLLRNAVGAWRAPIDHWRDVVHRDDDPLPSELAPWVEHMPWIPDGDPTALLLGDHRPDAGDARRAVRAARRELRTRRRFLAVPVRLARVEPRAEARLRARLGAGPDTCAPDDAFTGLEGEISITAASGPGRLTLLHEGRPLAVGPLDVPLAVDAVVAGADLTPTDDYRGVVIDDGYRRAERAARLAVVRAIEALCSDAAHPGVEVSAPRRAPGDGALVRAALSIAHQDHLDVDDDSPLAQVPLWRTHDGAMLGLAAVRALPVVGVADPADEVMPPSGRVLIHTTGDERVLLTELLGPAPSVVVYEGARARPPLDVAAALASKLVARTGAAVLIRREGALSGAVGFGSSGPTITLAHRGLAVETLARQPAHADCAIVIDSDAIVPSDDWLSVRDDGGVLAQDLAAWELALIRAAAAALLGDHVLDLLVPARPLRLGDATGRALCRALGAGRPGELLGKELAARLRAHPMLTVHGDDRRWSVDDLLEVHRGAIPALTEHDAAHQDAVEDWRPLVAGDHVRAMVAALAGRSVVDGSPELARRLRAVERERRLAAHRARAAEPLELPPGCAPIPLPGRRVRGVVGIGAGDAVEVVALYEGRRVSRIVSRPDLPLRAVVEVRSDEVDDQLTGLRDSPKGRILAAVRAGAGTLLHAIAEKQPTRFADDPAAQRLLAAWLAANPDGHNTTRDLLRTARAWRSLQGDRVSLAAAARGPSIQVASWIGTWIGGDPAHPLDGAVIALPAGDAGEAMIGLIDALGPWPTEDVTAEVLRLQAQRRIAKGIVAAPTVPGAARELTRRLDALDIRHGLGPGEIALDDGTYSRMLLHADGERHAAVVLQVVPAVQVAIEAPDLVVENARPGGLSAALRERLGRDVHALAVALVRKVSGDAAVARDLPTWLRRRLREALLAGHLEPDAASALPLFDTIGDKPASWAQIAAQERRFGDVWYVLAQPLGPPLDDRRVVLRLTADEARLAARLDGVTFIDAARELTLDAQARASRARKPLAVLELPLRVRDGALAVVELTGGARRGQLAVLAPWAKQHRGVWSCRGMVPFDRMSDPCAWPTAAIVDDPALVPDRTGARPVTDDAWRAVERHLVAASARALQGAVAAPDGARASMRIDAWPVERASSPWKSVAVTGVVWIDDDARGEVTVVTEQGEVSLHPPFDAPLSGRLLVAPEPSGMVAAVAALCHAHYPTLAQRAGVTPPRGEPAAWLRPPGAPPPAAREAEPVPSPPPAPAEVEPTHRLGDLSVDLRERLRVVKGLHRVTIAPGRRDPPVVIADDRVVLAGESKLLVRIATAMERTQPWAAAAIDALAGHALSLLNQARAPITDENERTALEAWLRREGR